MTPSKVDDLIAEVMLKHPSQTARGIAAYFEAVHQQLAPLARDLEAKLELEKQRTKKMSFSDKTISIKDRLRECAEQGSAWECEPSVISMMENAADEIDSLLALAKFGRWVLDMRNESDCADLYGEDIQDKAEKFGLLGEVMANEPCGENCYCETWADFPQPCMRLTDKAKVLDK